ncbi:hypothetical protein ACLF6K_37220 [Streptomyces xanthophaeus]|uniref:hypothetical protein n=1 Tax=Streptomyces xanthophaeus TaxID=67385 RepID=UPI00398FFA30
MSAYDWCAIFAVAGLIAVVAWYSCGPASARDQAAWDASTAVRTEADVQADLTEARRALEIAACYAIWPDPPREKSQLPHQTRRTEEEK